MDYVPHSAIMNEQSNSEKVSLELPNEKSLSSAKSPKPHNSNIGLLAINFLLLSDMGYESEEEGCPQQSGEVTFESVFGVSMEAAKSSRVSEELLEISVAVDMFTKDELSMEDGLKAICIVLDNTQQCEQLSDGACCASWKNEDKVNRNIAILSKKDKNSALILYLMGMRLRTVFGNLRFYREFRTCVNLPDDPNYDKEAESKDTLKALIKGFPRKTPYMIRRYA